MNNVISVGITILSQIFVGLILGLCWNIGMTEIGFDSISYAGAIAIWLGLLLIVFITSFVHSTVLRSVMFSNLYAIDSLTQKELTTKSDLKNDDKS